MPNVEVDESQLQGMQHTVKTVAKIMQDPKRRLELLRLQKEVEPDAVIPELDAQKPVQEAVETISKKMDDFIKSQTEREEKREADKKLADFTDQFEKGRKFLRDHGYDADGIAAVEKLMEERGISRHEDAGRIFEQLHPPAAPVTPSGFGSMSFLEQGKKEGEDEMSRLLKSKGNDEMILNQMIHSAINEGRAA